MDTESAAPPRRPERRLPASWMRRRASLCAAMLALVAAPAAAQQSVGDAGGRVYGLVGGGFGDGTFVATGAGAGLRLTPHLGLDLELTHLSGAVASGTPAHWFGGISVSSRAAATVGAPIEDFPALPVGFDPLFPTIHIEDRRRDVTTFLTRFTVEFPVADGRLFPYLTGGGVDVRLWRGLGIGIDVRWLRILRSFDALDTAQATARVSYRF